ncbi:MAG: DNA polymerase III subunit delta [Planctomycetota bacterium]
MNRASASGEPAIGKKIPVVVALVGDEERSKERLLAEILERAGQDAARISWTGEEGKPREELSRLLSDLCSRPLFGGCKVIVARDGEGLLKRVGQNLIAALDAEAGNHLVLLMRSLDNRTRLARRLKKEGGLISCVRPKLDSFGQADGAPGGDLVRALQHEARQHGLRMGGSVAVELAGRTGNDLLLAAGELEKLKLYLEDEENVTIRDVEAVVPRSAGWDQFQLFQEVATGDVRRALVRLRGMFQQGTIDRTGRRVTEPRAMAMTLLALLHNRLRLLARYRSLTAAGVQGEELRQALGIRNPGQLFYLGKEMNLPLVQRAESAVAPLAEADRSIKTGEPAATVLERLVVRLALLAGKERKGSAGTR